MIVDFEEKSHTYAVDGEIATISVTELLTKHGLSPYHFGAGKSNGSLKAKADIGKKVHKDLELVLNEKDYKPKTKQGEQFAKYATENFYGAVGEQILGFRGDGWTLCGTADIMAISKGGELVLADHKNTAQFHREYVTWQVNILDYMARKLGDEPINGKSISWKGAKHFYCFHYEPTSGEMRVVELERIPDTEIERLLLAEQNGETYQRKELIVEQDLALQVQKAEEYLLFVNDMQKEAVKRAQELREQMLALFEQQGIKSWETADKRVKVTYVDGADRLSVDSAKLKREYPRVFSEVQKLTKVKPSLRVTVREETGNGNGNMDDF